MSWRELTPNGAGVALQFQCATTTTTALTLNSSGDRAAFIILIAKAGNIRKVRFRTGTVTTGDTVRVSLQDLDASGDPDGTADQSQTVAIGSADDNTFFQVTLDADRTVAVGDLVAVVIDFSSYVAGNLGISVGVTSGEQVLGNLVPVYSDFYDGATWTKASGRAPQIILEYSDGSVAYQPACLPIPVNSSLTHNSSSNPKQYGNFIKFDETTRVIGAEFFIDSDAAFDVVLYQTGDTDGSNVLASKAGVFAARAVNQINKTTVLFTTPATCVGGSSYRLVLKPGASNITAYHMGTDAAAAGDLNVFPGGSDWHKVELSSSNVWSANTLRRVAIWPIIDAIDVKPNMSGGHQA